jgi:hypothetical protein
VDKIDGDDLKDLYEYLIILSPMSSFSWEKIFPPLLEMYNKLKDQKRKRRIRYRLLRELQAAVERRDWEAARKIEKELKELE